MPKIAIVTGTLLAFVGFAGAAHAVSENKTFVTALIPVIFGGIFEGLGLLSLAKPSLRKHMMHALAALALVGTLAAAGRLGATWTKPGVSPVARGSQAAMAILCAVTLGCCIKSFRDARRAREALPAA